MNRAQRRRAARRAFHAGQDSGGGQSLCPDNCEVCDVQLGEGEIVRLLLDEAGGHVYGHKVCIDGLVAERRKLGQHYLGDFDAA